MKKIIIVFVLLFLFGCSGATTGDNKTTIDITTDEPILDNNPFIQIEEIYNFLVKYHYSSPNPDDLLEGALNGLYEGLGDPFTFGSGNYFADITPSSDGGGVSKKAFGFTLSIPYTGKEIFVKDVVYNGPAYRSGVRAGDYIISLWNQEVSSLSYFEIEELFSKNLDQLIFKTKRGNKVFEHNINSEIIVYDPIVSSRRIDDKTGYLKITSFENDLENGFLIYDLVDEELYHLPKLVPNMETLIIDLRGNLGGQVSNAYRTLKFFVEDHDNKPMFTLEGYNYDGENLTYKTKDYFADKETKRKDYDIKILVDEMTASAAEIFASVMQSYMGYEVIGRKTFGKGIYQNDVQITDSYSIHISLGKWYYYEDERVNLHGIGLMPDKIVEDSPYYLLPGPSLKNDILYDTVNTEQLVNIALMLNALGYNVRTDGYFDSKMDETLNQFFIDNDYSLYERNRITQADADFIYYLYYGSNQDLYDDVLQAALGA